MLNKLRTILNENIIITLSVLQEQILKWLSLICYAVLSKQMTLKRSKNVIRKVPPPLPGPLRLPKHHLLSVPNLRRSRWLCVRSDWRGRTMATSDSLGKGGNWGWLDVQRWPGWDWDRLSLGEGRRRDELIRFEVPLQSRLFGPGCTLTPHWITVPRKYELT